MTPDLKRLREKLKQLDSFVDALELELVDDPRWAEPSDTSYLNEHDRANPDIMANVEAMAKTNELIAWWGRDSQGFVGLWQGPRQLPLEQAPIVRLDTEGQYALVAVRVGDYLAISMFDDDFEALRKPLVAAGFAVAESQEAVWKTLETFDEPNDYRHTLYNEGRVRRGLEPIEQ